MATGDHRGPGKKEDRVKDPRAAMLRDARVALASLPRPAYDGQDDRIAQSLVEIATPLGWPERGRGPFGAVIRRGARVLVKPNLVLHENEGPWGMEPLVTHISVIRAVVEAALLADPAAVTVGDAPLQGCDFDRLLRVTGLGEWAQVQQRADPRFKGVIDFRRTICTFSSGVRQASEGVRPEDHFVLYDLGGASLLEPITDNRGSFRVTCYDPRLLAKTHRPGRHRYLIAKDVIEADVVINLPKLKTHKKAGITCALKNLVGINGNKEYLPHHRVGGSGAGGDCYPDRDAVKRLMEYAADRENMASSLGVAHVWHGIGRQLDRVSRRLLNDLVGIEGSWSGNDTVWRMCLDLNRILLYGRRDGTLADQVQRTVIHVADAIVAGQGDGPLSPQPLPLGLLFAAPNAAAMDWIGAHLLGYDPARVPIVREAFTDFRWPLTAFPAGEVEVFSGGQTAEDNWLGNVEARHPPVLHPVGWRDAALMPRSSSSSAWSPWAQSTSH